MTAPSDESVEPVTDHSHDNSWSANPEKTVHADDRELVREQAETAIEQTVPGNHVNLVAHANHGHPETSLLPNPDAACGDDTGVESVRQCGCGGHVTRVYAR
ncbi:CGCGG family rSAM-modified RiPP protein [Haloarcula sp. S1CR25-12]|uniref:CGCGG family rSAM-modified RiPP protein n=1 Tax=Haloarcula saliterrae TaxID=2950534 RepID=A0ABU2FGZ6_9EURY|nr:CGCGG family rSAM-modified RiPP protein [Haloarcula sp. S1CR25-12]MDS0261198.1 CGCGG family rSAM-modified RiPP protein [Haloarcula sp. S1CR25-12]